VPTKFSRLKHVEDLPQTPRHKSQTYRNPLTTPQQPSDKYLSDMSRMLHSMKAILVAYIIVVALQTAVDGQYVLSTVHEDSACTDAAIVSWVFSSLDCAPTPGGTYAKYDCVDNAPTVRVFSQPDCRAASSVVNSSLPTTVRKFCGHHTKN
jgi:hypothetical protein